MALRGFLQLQVQSAFKQLQDIPRPFTYIQRGGTPVRDVVTGKTAYPETTRTIPRVVPARFKENEVDTTVNVATDQKLLFPRLDLDRTIIPRSSDKMIDEHGFVWEVQRLLSDPADAVVIVHVRTSKKVAP